MLEQQQTNHAAVSLLASQTVHQARFVPQETERRLVTFTGFGIDPVVISVSGPRAAMTLHTRTRCPACGVAHDFHPSQPARICDWNQCKATVEPTARD